MGRMRTLVGESDLRAQDQRPNFDLQPKFFSDFTFDSVPRILAVFNPAAGQTPGEVGPEHMLNQEHATVVAKDHTHCTDGLPGRLEPGRDAKSRAQGSPVAKQT